MKINYKVIERTEPFAFTYIEATYEDGTVTHIPADTGNSDYQRYLRWLENPDAEENGTIS